MTSICRYFNILKNLGPQKYACFATCVPITCETTTPLLLLAVGVSRTNKTCDPKLTYIWRELLYDYELHKITLKSKHTGWLL
jgi:hypothetical protein